ncbi:MAG TPA: signal peptidase II [Thermomicrobiaceae bacterium]|nr:signal peptidase II [Thermomicrobiaceae bacterium]
MTGSRVHAGRGFALALGVAAVVLVADQLSKAAITAALGPGSGRTAITIVPNLLQLFYVENTGAAFGIFQGGGAILTPLAVVVVAVLAIAFRRLIAESAWLSVALGLQFGGAIGNIVDRLHHGYVVDFITVPHWPTFNVADSCITVGVIILGVVLFLKDVSEPSDEAATPTVTRAGAPASDDSSNHAA